MKTTVALLITLVTTTGCALQSTDPRERIKEKIYVAVWETSLFMDGKTKEIKSTSPGKSHLAVIDPSNGTITGKILVGDCPMRLGIAPDGRCLYVPCQMDKFLYVVDTEKDVVIKKIPAVEGMGVDFLPDGSRAYVSSAEGVLVVDAKRHEVIDTLPYREGYYVRASPDGRFVVVTGYNKTNYAVIDVAENRLEVRQVKAEGGTKGVSFLPDGKRMAMVLGNRAFALIDAASGNILKEIAVGNKSWLCIVEVAGDGSVAYVTDSNEKRIYVVDLAQGKVSGTIATAGIGAIGFGFAGRERDILFTTDFLGDGTGKFGIVSTIDLKDRTIVRSTKVGAMPAGIAVKSPYGNHGS